jgi:hypothetical protein
MKAIISSTYDDQYFFFVPIVAWCWKKLGVDTVCICPKIDNEFDAAKAMVMTMYVDERYFQLASFRSDKNKQATYSQCARLYASASISISENEYLVISDVDMALFNNPFVNIDLASDNDIDIFGADLVPQGQFPMCYIGAKAKTFSRIFNPDGLSFQGCLDKLLGDIECENMRGNYWGKDQETAYNEITKHADHAFLHNRARPGTQFADNRYDRDDAFLLDRLSPNTIDFHMPRPGYEESNFSIILAVLKYHYPLESFDWLVDYRDDYIKLL